MKLLVPQMAPYPRTRIDRRQDYLWLCIIFCVGALLLLAIFLSVESSRIKPHSYGLYFEMAAGGLGLWLGMLIVWWTWKKGRFDPFEPPVWISINVYFQVVLNIWLLQRDRVTYIPWLRDSYTTMMPLAVLLFFFALTSLWAGYVWASRRLSAQAIKSGPFTTGPVRISSVKLIWFIGWMIKIIVTLTGISSYLGTSTSSSLSWLNYLEFINIVTSVATMVLVFLHFQRPTLASGLWLTLVIASDILMALVVGSKSFALTLLWLAMYIYYATGKLSKRILVMGAIIVILLVPVINNYRVLLAELNIAGGVPLSARVQVLETALNDALRQPFGQSFQTTSDTFQGRQGSMLDLSASALFLHPSRQPFVGGEMLADFLPRLIPRILWPDKPLARSNLYFITSTYGGAPSEHSFSEIGLVADSYRAGGWGFVFVWFGIVGIFCAWLYHHGPARHNMAGTAFYIAILTHILKYEGVIAITMINLIQFGLLLWLVITQVMFMRPRILTSTQRPMNYRGT